MSTFSFLHFSFLSRHEPAPASSPASSPVWCFSVRCLGLLGGTRADEALARELALGYRAVADVAAAVEAIHEAGVLNVDRFDFVGDV